MLKRVLATGLAAGLLAAPMISCGGSSSPPRQVGNGALLTVVGDTPLCDILTFRMLVSSIDFFEPNSNFAFRVFPGLNPGTAVNITVNFGGLRDFTTVLNLAAVPALTYDRARINFLVPQATIFNPTKTPPTSTLSTTLVNGRVTILFNPPLVITKGRVAAMRMDIDMRHSFQLDSQGQLTGKVTPAVTLIPLTNFSTEGFGEMDDMVGFVRNVNTSSSGPSFIGSIGLQFLSGTGPFLNANLTNSTLVYGVSGLDQLPTDSLVEMDGSLDPKGNLVASTVEVEDREVVETNKVAFLGVVTSISKDSSGNVTQFTLLNQEEEPDISLNIFLDQNLVVNISPTTVFQYSSRSANFATLPFDPTAMAVGQQVIVHGTATKSPNPSGASPPPPDTVAAERVYLKLQTHEGNFVSLVQAGSDGKTGAFWLMPCASIFQRTPILVLTDSQTVFLNLPGLSGLAEPPQLLVKGLLFFELQGTTINGVTVPPGTLVLVAKQVHQLG